jgi:cell division protein FtsB
MKREMILGLFFGLMLLSNAGFVLAADTNINIRSYSNIQVYVMVLEDSQTYQLIDVLKADTDIDGMTAVFFEDPGNNNKVKINVQLNRDGEKFHIEKFDAFPTGEPLYLQVRVDNSSRNYLELDAEVEANKTEVESNETVILESNETESNETEIESNETEVFDEENNESFVGITGKVISDFVGNFSNITYYIIGGVFLALVIVVFVLKVAIGRSPAGELKDAERKLEQAQKEIQDIKDKEKILEAKKKIEEDRKALKDLKKGKSDDKDKLDSWEDEN